MATGKRPLLCRMLAGLIVFAAIGACSGNDAAAPARTVGVLAKVIGDHQAGTAGAALGVLPSVEAKDAEGRPMAGVSVRIDVNGGGALSDTVLITGSDGRASTTWILGPDAAAVQSLRMTAGSTAAEFTATASAPRAGETYLGRNGYIEYIAGDLPIIITVPHGGTLTPGELPDRTGSDVTTVRDSDTEELARTIGNVFSNEAGGRPHIIIVRLRRTKLDANRPILEAALGNRLAGRAWIEFHSFTDAAKQAVIARNGTGFYIDLHGHGHAIPRLELGYLLPGGILALSDDAINAGTYESRTGIRMLSQASPASFAEILRGPTSLGALFEAAGFPAVPSPASPNPGNSEYFEGGYNTDRHGSRGGGPISGVQIETNFTGVRDSQVNRERFAHALVSVLADYLALHRAAATAP